VVTGQRVRRFDGFPTLSQPFSVSFLQVDPRASPLTRYGNSSAEDGSVTGPALDRAFFEGSVEARGPTFSRVFVSGGQPKVKHVIGPEFTLTYRSAVDDFDLIPKFDGLDQFLGTNQVEYALVDQVLVKRPGPAGSSRQRAADLADRPDLHVQISEIRTISTHLPPGPWPLVSPAISPR
jgi:hypothetical protein